MRKLPLSLIKRKQKSNAFRYFYIIIIICFISIVIHVLYVNNEVGREAAAAGKGKTRLVNEGNQEDLFVLIKSKNENNNNNNQHHQDIISNVHCTFSMLENSDESWRGAACFYKHLCYHKGKLNFYVGSDEAFAEAYVTLPVDIQLGAANSGKKYKPNIVREELPFPRYVIKNDEENTWVLYDYSGIKSPLEFIRDVLFGIWLLAKNAPWKQTKYIIPFHYKPTDGEENNILVENESAFDSEFYSLMFGSRFEVKPGMELAPICFSNFATGLTLMTSKCVNRDHLFHASEKKVALNALPCAMGRGGMYYELRNSLLASSALLSSHAKVLATANKPNSKVLIALTDVKEAKLLQTGVSNTIREVEILSGADSLEEQIKQTLSTCVYITSPLDLNSKLVHFLPRWSVVVLLSSELEMKKFPHYGYYENLGYIRVNWVAFTDPVRKRNEFLRMLSAEIEKCHSFYNSF